MSIEEELNGLYKDLETVQAMSDDAVCASFNADNKHEYIDMLNDEIGKLEDKLEEKEKYMGRERNFMKSADKPFLCW